MANSGTGVIMAAKGPQVQEIDLTKLNLQQLTHIKQQLDQELSVFQDSLHTLKIAQGKFQDSADSLEKISPDSKGKDILVPLTGSVYVPGKVADSEKVIIDIGTGYYITKDIPGAKEYFKNKINFVTEQMEKIQSMGMDKSKIRDAVVEIMEERLRAQFAAQTQVPAKT